MNNDRLRTDPAVWAAIFISFVTADPTFATDEARLVAFFEAVLGEAWETDETKNLTKRKK